MEKRKIKKVAVLGSGIMGSRIACHFANIGLEVELLDIPSPDGPDRNALVNGALQQAVKSKPAPLYHGHFARRIRTGNLEDDLDRIKDADWIVEVVIERLDIKQQLLARVDAVRKPGSLVTSNTSGIPIEWMTKDRSDDFVAHFCGTHFFNPPRYLPLLEVIPSSKTRPEVVDFFMHYGDLYLGKKTVRCKDTPAFIANRIGVFNIMAVFRKMREHGLSIEEVDAITGPITGRPKSATFRTSDLVGLDTLVKVAQGVGQNCPEDEMKEWFAIPDFLETMVERKWLGDKTGQGFYKKGTDEAGNRRIEALRLDRLDYEPSVKVRTELIGQAKQMDSLEQRLKFLYKSKDRIGDFLRDVSLLMMAYSANRIPEIADELYSIDDALRAGFGWELGPFQQWDAIGFERILQDLRAAELGLPGWLEDMVAAGHTAFYKRQGGRSYYYSIAAKDYVQVPGTEASIQLDNYRDTPLVFGNKECSLHDIGDGVLCLEFHTKMNAIGSGILQGINRSIDIAEREGWNGLVLGNDAPNFSAGANLAMMLMLAIEQEYDELNMAIRYFQNTVMRLRYSAIPVVIAPHGLTLGGGCEMSLHADSAVVAAETYIGLVEAGAGLIPGGGGTKEFAVRLSDEFKAGDPEIPNLQRRFTTIATAQVATSAYEAFDLGVLHDDKDEVVVNGSRLIAEAKRKVLELSADGYTQAIPRDDIRVLGRTALGALYAGVEAFGIGNYASEHDVKIGRKLAYVMSGGDLTQASEVTEQYLLDLEREAFLSLLGERKTLERIQHILKTGKPLRN